MAGPKALDWISKDGNRDPDKVNFSDLPEETFAIQFFDRLYAEYTIGDVVHPVQSGQFNVSPVIWMKGKLLTPAKLKSEYPDVADNIIMQMDNANVGHVVYVMGTFKPFVKDTDIFWNNLGRIIYNERPTITRN